MTDKEKEIIKMIDEVASTTFGINAVHIKSLKERYMKAPFSIDEIRKKVEEHCKEIEARALERIF